MVIRVKMTAGILLPVPPFSPACAGDAAPVCGSAREVRRGVRAAMVDGAHGAAVAACAIEDVTANAK